MSPSKDSGAAKKPNYDSSTILKHFLEAMQEDGPLRSQLLRNLPATPYYRCRGLYLQHKQGDCHRSKYDKNEVSPDVVRQWKTFKGCLQMDAYGDLLKEIDSLSKLYSLFD